MRIHPTALPGLLCSMLISNPGLAQDFDKLKQALGDEVSADWIYEDIEAGYAMAKKTGKPLLVTFR
jgi:hypothetical protein